jgi:hypothetical protein
MTNSHRAYHISDLLPAYLNRTLDPHQTALVEGHLSRCNVCRAELADWRKLQETVSVAATAPVSLPPDLLMNVRSQIAGDAALIAESNARRVHLPFVWTVMRSQLRLMRGAIWIAAAATFGIGLIVAMLLANPSASALVFAFFAPIIGAVSVAFIYQPENDPTLELALATPTSPRLVLLARLTFVYGYDLLLALMATIALAFFKDDITLWPLITLWLFPMFFLSALTLTLSMIFNVTTAAVSTMSLWTVGLIIVANSRTGISAAKLVDLINAPESRQLFVLLGLACFTIAFGVVGVPERWEKITRSGGR